NVTGVQTCALPIFELVQRYRLEGNRKEVHLRLTPLGEEIHDAHRRLHAEMTESFLEFLAQYQQADLEVVARMLTDLLHVPRRGVRFKIEGGCPAIPPLTGPPVGTRVTLRPA